MNASLPLSRSARPVATWLFVGVGMLIIQILLGGITRLTGSGLSITEWNVVSGSLPPLSEQQWLAEFEKYRQTPQFKILNFDFTLADYKFIYFWEWFHRFWARLMGFVFAIPFIYFLVKGYFKKEMVKPLIILFLLGALQGAIGWIMVASGLTGDAVYVRPTRLALHFLFALGLLCYTYWFALSLRIPSEQFIRHNGLRKWTWVLIGVLVVQLFYGALMAGYKAATAAPTWPDINGAVIPDHMFENNTGIAGLIDNKITIHFIHRGLAYLLFVLILVFTFRLRRISLSRLLTRTSWLPMLLVLIQVTLGIMAVLASTGIVPGKWGGFEWVAQLHQLVAMFLLLSLVWILYLVRGSRSPYAT